MSKYLSKKYLNPPRMLAYAEQFRYVEDGDCVLEIGNAGGVFQQMVTKIAKYVSVDIDPESKPDFVFDLSNVVGNEKEKLGKFDKVFCCEVLEHIPFEKLGESLENLFDFSKDLVVISIPDNRKYARFSFGWGVALLKKVISVPFSGEKVDIKKHGEHYFEIYSKNHNIIRGVFFAVAKKKGFGLIKDYRFFDRPYQHFFIFQKQK